MQLPFFVETVTWTLGEQCVPAAQTAAIRMTAVTVILIDSFTWPNLRVINGQTSMGSIWLVKAEPW